MLSPRRILLVVAILLALLSAAFIAVFELATLRGAKAHDASAFLTKELGQPQSHASLVRTPTRTSRVEFTKAGVAASTKAGRLTLASNGPAKAAWTRYEHGVARDTSFGRETITTSGTQVEQFLTVNRHQGRRTWTWDLGTTLDPHSRPDGTIEFASSKRTAAAFQILPPQIVGAGGKDVTPAGLRWNLRKKSGSWQLRLTLDDSRLAVPYVIDPLILFDVASSSSAFNATSLTWNATVNVGAPVHANRILLVGYNAEHTTSSSCQATSVTYNGTAMTLAGQNVAINPSPNYDCVAIYYLLNPATGTHPVVMNFATTTDGIVGGAVSLYNVFQAAPDAVQTSQSAGMTSTSITTPYPNMWVIDAIGPGDVLGNMAVGAGQTSRVLTDSSGPGGSDSLGMSTIQLAAAGSQTMAWTRTPAPNRSAQVAVAFQSVDTTNPSAPALTLGESSPLSFINGSTLYYNGQGANSGTFTVDATSTDTDSGIKKINFPALTGITGGGDDLTSPYQGSYSWTGTSTATGAQTVTATNGNNMTATNTFTLVRDVTAPTGGALTVNGTVATGGGSSSYLTSGTSVTVNLRTNYAEAGPSGTAAGLASSLLVRDQATLSNDSCGGTWSNATTLATVSGGTDSGLASATCYRYTLTGTDNVGNAVSLVTIVKVDTSAPSTPTLAFSNLTNAFYSAGLSRLYFRPAAGGTIKVTASSTDTETGIKAGNAGYTFLTMNSNGGANFTETQTGAVMDYTFGATATAPTTNRTISATNNASVASGNASYAVTSDSTAPAGGVLTVNGSAASGAGTSSFSTSGSFTIGTRTDYTEAQSATASGLASSTLTVASASYSSPNTCGAFGAPSTIVGAPAQGPLATGCYLYTLTGTDNVGNTVSISTTVKVDTSDPALTLTLGSASGGAYYPGSGTRVYFRPATAGQFNLTPNPSDSDTGIASTTVPTAAAMGANWSRSGAGPYTYSYVATGGTPGTQTVTTQNNAGRSTNATFDVTADTNAPTGGALTVNATAASGAGTSSYSTSGNFTIGTRTDYAETQSATESGLASSTLTRASASYSSPNTCGSYGAPTTIVGSPAQGPLATGCYLYTLTGTDNVGNTVSISTTVKVDTSAPSAPTFTFANLTGGAYYPGAGTRVYFKPDAVAGSFDITASSTDADTGVASYTFPTGAAIGTNWSASGAGATRTYSYSPVATTTGTQNVTATNNAGTTSANGTFDVTLDSTAPAGGALTVNGVGANGAGTQSYDSDGTFPIDARTDYSEAQSATASGLASSTVTRAAAAFSSADTCGSFGAPTTLVGTPAQSSLATGCYRYTLTGTDNVGNAVSISTIVKVDTSAPSAPSLTLSNATGGAFYPGAGTRVYFKPDAAAGGFDIAASSTDNDSGIASYTFPTGAAVGTNWSVSGAGASRTYNYTATATTTGTQSASATNRSGLSSSSNFDVTLDSTAPAGGAVTVNGTAASGAGTQSYDGDGNFTIGTRTDYTEAQSATASGLASSTLTRASASYTSTDTCGSFGAPTTLVGTPAQNGLATGCYRYTLTGTDNVGNAVSISTVVKVDTSAPSAPSLTPSNATGGAYYPGSGTRIFFRPGAAAGSFDIGASSTDTDSGVASYQFPAGAAIGTNWSVSGSGSSRTYSYTPTATTNGTQNVTATNNAGVASSASTFDVTADSTAPAGGALTVNAVAANGGGTQSYDGDGNFTIGLRTDYSETASATESGLASSTLVRTTASYTGSDTCGVFGSPSTLVGTPAQNGLATGCYKYTLTGTDNVGNAVSISTIVKVDTSAPSAPSLSFSNATGGSYYPGSGTRVYFKPDAAAGSFDVGASATDGDSGVASYQFPTGATVGSNWSAAGSGSSRTYSYTATATTNGTQSVTATNNAGLASSGSSFDVTADSTAPAGGALTVNGVAASGAGTQSYDGDGNFTIGLRNDYSETQSATASGLAFSSLARASASYTSADTCGAFGAPTTLVGTPAQNGLATGCYRYTLTGTDNVGNTVSISTIVKVDTSAPSAPSLTLSNASGGAYYPGSGTRVYFKPDAAAGGFDVAASSTDGDSGVASYQFPAGAAIGTNWGVSGSGSSRTYSYTATATTTGTQSVTATNNAGIASAASTFDVTLDSTAPAGGALTVNGVAASGAGTQSYDGDGNFTIGTRTDYTEAQSATASGLAFSSLSRASASYTSADTCGAFGAPTTLVGTPAQNGLTTGCYRYTLTGTDNVGNTVSISTIVKVDTTGPSSPSLTPSNGTGGAYYPGSGTRVYFKPDAAAGGFDISASSTDSDSGVASYQFPTGAAVGTNWSVSGSGSSRTYNFTATATTNGTQNVTATNNAGVASAASTFDVTLDSTTPAGGALTVNGVAANGGGTQSYDGDGNFTIGTRTDYTEAQSATASGLASSTLTRASASYTSADTCGSFGAPTTLVGTPAQNGLATGCYRYTLTGTDNVGNAVSISTIVKVDTSAPSAPSLTPSNATGGAYYPGSGTRVYFKPDAAAGSFDIGASATDSDSGVASYQFPAGAAIGTNWGVSGAGASRTYSYTATATTNGAQSVTATNNAGIASAASTFDVTLDSTAPAGGALTVNAVAANGGGTQSYDGDGSFPIDLRTDYSEAQSASASGLAFSTLSRASASYTSADTCGSFGAPTTLVGTPAQSSLATGCYRYTLTGTDNVGNTVSISTIVKVDTSGPSAPGLTLSNATGGAYYPGSGTRVYFKPDAAAGSFDIGASATDSDSGVASYQFPTGAAIGTNWAVSGSGSSRTYNFTATATTNGTQGVTATNNAGVVSAGSSFDVTLDSTAPAGGALTVNGTAASGAGTQSYDGDGNFTIGSRTDYAEAQSATASGLAFSSLSRASASYTSADTCGAFGAPTTLVGTPAQNGLTTGCYRYTLTGTDNVGNTVSISTIVKVDTTGPSAPSLTLSNATGGAFYPGAGTRIFFRPGAAAGSFDIGASSTDTDSGVASYQFPTGAAVGTNWSVSGSGSSRTYSHTPTATTNGTQNVTATNNAGVASSASTFDVTADSTAPAGGALTVNAVAANGGGTQSYDGDGSFPINLRTDYAETASATESGLASSVLVRTSASFTSADTCGAFGSPSTLVGTPAQNGLATGCYKYTLTGTDNVGNAVSISTIVKVDTSAPSAPSLSFSNATGGSYYPGAGTRIYFKPDAANGTFDLTAASTDTDSGVASYSFPTGAALGTNWAMSGSGSTRTYSFTPTATSNGTQTLAATNNAGLTSGSTSFDLAGDGNAPTGGALTVNGQPASGSGTSSFDGDGSFAIDLRTDYAETQTAAESGLASSTLVRTNAPYSSPNVCGAFGSATTLVGTPAQSGLATACYRYTLTGTDNVGNTVSVSTLVKVDNSAPTQPTLSFTGVSGGAYYPGAGTRVFFKPNAAAGGSFDLTASATDNDTDVASYQFPSGVTVGTNWSFSGTGATRTYSYTPTATTNGTQSVTATNNAGGISTGAGFDVTADASAPTGGALTVNSVTATGGGSQSYDGDGSFTIGTRTDYAEVASSTDSGLASSTLTRESATLGGDSCGTFGSSTTLVGSPAQNGLATGCYRYTLTGTDNVGNTVSISTIVKVDTSAPTAPSLTLSSATGGAYYPGSGSRIFFRPDAVAGSFDVSATSSDADTGVASYAFPTAAAVGTNWSVSGSGASRTYSYTPTATSNGTQNVTAANPAGGVSANGTFDVTADSSAPAGGSLSVNGTAATGGGSTSIDSDGSFAIDTRTDYSETASATESGLASSTLTRESAGLTGNSCGGYGAPTTLVGTPAQNGLATGCYRYTLTGVDNVGNSVTLTTVVKVDTSAPSTPSLTLSNVTGGAYYPGSGSTVYFLPSAVNGSFDVAASSTDGDSGVATYQFPAGGTVGSNWSASGSGGSRTYSFTTGATTTGAQSVTATNGAGGVSAASTFTVASDSTAPTTSIQCNGAACIAGYYLSAPVSVTLGAVDGGSGVQKIRYTTDGSDPTPVNGSDYSGAISVNTTTTVKFRAYDNLGNVEAVGSQTIQLDGTPPTGPVLTLTETPASGAQHVSGTTLFYRPGGGGTFRIDAATSDPETGIAQVAFPSIANVTGGSTQTSSPYQETYTWGASTSDNGSHNVVATNNSGAGSSAGFTLKPDSTAPSAQSISLGGAGAYYTTSVPFILGDGSDNVGGSGLDTSSRAVTRETANLVGDVCGSFTADPGTYTSPDASVTGGHCYRYSFTIKDNVANTSVPTTTVAKVDTAAPSVVVAAPTETAGAANQYYDSASKTQFFRPGGSGSFTLNATASDTHTAVTQVAFPNVSATSGWGGSTGGPDITSPYASPNPYSWSVGATAPGAVNVVGTDKAGNNGSDTITLAADGTAPTGQTLTLTGGSAPYFTSTSVTFTAGNGTDNVGGSGLDLSSRTITRETANLAGNSCGAFSADPGTFSSPDTSVTNGHCYRYTFTIADNVGNVSTAVTVTAKVDTTSPSTPSLSFGSFTSASVTGTTVFFRQGSTGGFTVSSSSSDTETGIASTTFPSLGSGWTNTGGAYSFDATATAPGGNQNVTTRNGAGVDSAAASFTVVGDATAPVSSVQCNGAACSAGWYTSAPVNVTLSATDGFGSGLDRIRYSTDGTDPTLLNGSDYVGAIAVGSTTTIKYRAFDNVGNVEPVVTQTVQVDTTPPSAPVLTLGEASPFEYATGTTLFYNPSGSNSAAFTVSGTSTDAESAIQKLSFPSLTGMVGGGDDTSSPYQASYGWDNTATASPGSADVTAFNKAGLTSQSSFTVTKDVDAPTGGSVTYPDGFQTSTSVTVSTADGNDGSGAGVDATTGVLERRTATLTNGACAGFAGLWSPVTSPDTVANGTCVQYRYRVSDRVGNEAIYTSGNVVEVDTTAPAAPALSLSESSPYELVSGTTLFYNPSGSNSASFTVDASAADAQSGVTQVDFPTVFGADSSSQASGPYSNGYSWTSGATATGAKTVTVTNGSGLQSTADFTVTPDTTAPSGGTFDYADGYSTTGNITITTPSATDGGAGVDATSAVLERQTATLSGGSCGSFGGWSPVTSPDTVASGLCAVYRYRISDKVGNEATYTSPHVVEVDSAGPTVSVTDPGSPVAGTIAVAANASDALSNVQQVVFQRSPAGAGTWTQIGAADTTAPYSVNWNTTALVDGLYDLRAIATDNAGNTTTSAIVASRRVDNTPPSTTIDSSPADPDNDATPTFAFSSSEPGSTFECRIDGGAWTSCSSPFTVPALGEGSHTFDVRAIDPAGNTDPTPASRTWTIDLTAPTATWNTPASGANVSASVTLDASSEPGATIAYSYSPAGANTWTSTGSSWNTVPLGDGPYDLRAIATDTAGNPSAPAILTNLEVDNHAPTVSITAPGTYLNAADPNPFTITATSPDSDLSGVKFYECSDASIACGTGTWNLISTDPTAPYSASWSAPVADGKKAIRAVATDNAANTGSDVKTITIDRSAPSGVSINYTAGYVSGALTLTTSNGPDADVVASTGTIERRTATLTNDTCGSFGAPSTVTSPDTISSGLCAEYRYSVADQAGNVTTTPWQAAAKRDAAAPTSLQDDPGAFLRQSVSLTASASDTDGSGIDTVAFQRRPAGGGAWTTIGSDSSSPFSVSFDTTAVPDGLYDFRTVATDVAGNTEAAPVLVANRRVDNTAPSATLLTPVDSTRVKGSVALTASTGDAGGSGVASVSFELAPVPGAFASVATPWDTTGVVDGAYRLRVVATDNAGNTTTSAVVNTTVDNTPPSVIFSSPAGGAVVSGTVALNATASDASPASPAISFEYKLHSDPPSAYTATGASWDTTAIADGLYDLRASATDDAGNTTRVENASILSDNFPPSISITAPATSINASVASPTAFDASASDGGSGVQKVDFYECSNTSAGCATGTWNLIVSDSTPPYGSSWTIPADGNHALRAVATDNANHSSSAIRNVNVDRTAPTTTITGKPADPSNAAPTFTFTSNEPGSTFECALDGGAWAPCSSPKTYAGLADGTHTVDVRATDAAGNLDATPDSWTWLRDTTAPTASIGDPGANVRQTVVLTSTQSDPGGANASGIASVQFEYSGDGGSSWATTPAAWDTTAVTDGLYKVHVVVTDNAGNKATALVGHDVRVDNTAPTTSQDDPGQYLRATKTLTGSAADAGSGIDHVDFQQSPAGAGPWTTVAPDSSSPFSASFDTTTVSDGHYDFRTIAYDVAGNQTISTVVPGRLVDNTAPNATMIDPGPYLRGTVGLGSTTSDPNGANGSGIASVAYEYSTDGGTSWSPTAASFNTTAVADGNVRLHVVATDNAGNVTTSSAVSDLVDNTKPATTDNAPSGYQSSPVTVSLSASDSGSGVNVTQYSVDGGSYVVGTSVNVPAPSDGSNDGAHTIAYFSVDNAGNIEQGKSTTVLIDATPPTCPACSAADYLRGNVTLQASPSSGGSAIQSVTFEYSPAGAGTWTPVAAPDTTGPAPYTAAWDTTGVADGHYDLRIIVVDGAGNSTTTTLADKVVDNTQPNLALVGAPTEGAVVSGNVGINASAGDVTSGVASVEFFVRGVSVTTDNSAPWNFNWNSTSAPDGPATIYVVVTDMAGNSTTSPVRTVTVDNGAPAPTLADPRQYLRGNVGLNATSDADTTQVDFQRAPAGSGTWTTIATDNTSPFSTSLDTTLLPDGLYDFRVVAVDGNSNSGTSSVRANVRIDNTAPAGSLTAPAAGANVGGTAVNLAVSASDAGSGVASVRYEFRATGGSAFAAITSSSTSPFGGSWNTTGLASGSYDLRPVITDRAGNEFTGAVVTVTVDATAPKVTLADPGANLSGTVQLNATVIGNGATKVVFSSSPAGANSWTSIGTDPTSPYGTSFDTTQLPDGVYDLRAVVFDSLGNSSESVRTGIRIDNNAPRLVSSTPADGSRVDEASSIELVLSEEGTPKNVTLDGTATVAPVVNGTHVTYGTGALGVGPHTLAGELTDASGHSSPFRVHFTVWKVEKDAMSPLIEKNTSASAGTTLTSADSFAHVTMPAGAWTASGSDWLVLKIKPQTAPAGLTNGFGPAAEVVDVTAYWALTGGYVHQFGQPIQIVLPTQAGGVVPATSDSGGWRVLRRVPSAPSLPASWNDGFYTDAAGFHILTRHLTQFTLLKDFEAPSRPTGVRGYSSPNGIDFTWQPGPDNSGTYDHVSVLVDGSVAGAYAAGTNEGTVAGDLSRTFTLNETDLAGNVSNDTKLAPVPPLVGLSPEDAAAALEAAGFHAGDITTGGEGPAGTVSGPANLVLAEEGATIDLTVADGSGAPSTKLVFSVISTPKAKTTQRTLGARIRLTRAARVTAILYTPKSFNRARGVKLYTWRFALHAGTSIVKLRLPTQVRHPGMYRLGWTATAGRDAASRSRSLRVFRTILRSPAALKQRKLSGQVVVAGSKVQKSAALRFGKGGPKLLRATSIDAAFDLAARNNGSAAVMVVDVDELGVDVIRDLRVVFPSLKIVAVSTSPAKLAAAKRAGANVTVRRAAAKQRLTKVVTRLLRSVR